MKKSSWKKEIEQERRKKDEFFKRHPRSPIPSEEMAEFEGLTYFPIDSKYRFKLSLHEHEEREKISIETTKEGEQEYIRWGEFRFALDNNDYTLQAYKSSRGEKRLWVPFRDETSGEETYGAGRYLDLEPENDKTEDGKWILDFNKAYNPFCAFSDMYECPFIPPENWLDVEVKAGEKSYH